MKARYVGQVGKLRVTVAALGLALTCGGAYAAEYPAQPIQLVVGYGAGGGTDMCFRALAVTASKKLGQSIVVENKPGAGSSLSIGYIVRQKPDGYSIAALSTGAVLNPYLVPNIDYDVQKDLTPIAMVAQYQVGLLVRQDSTLKSLSDIIEVAKKEPGKIAFSTAGVGTPQHLTMEKLGEEVGAKWTHVPYKSGIEASTALIRGDVEVMAQTAEWVPYVRDGRLRLLNVFTEDRMAGFEDAPTLVEEGYQLVAPSILGLVGPKGMDPAVVAKIDDAFKDAIDSEAFQQCTDQFGLKVDYKNASEFTQYIQGTIDTWAPVIKSLDTN
ncbi:Bug family tripartite tricarboxylate transporter substrate binding protein [Allopusillimonas ginsengisoli]|uniref:Bug family tripartite tricarboxylate transporter substrate binding protein n=1 Tax=Allopusillimonas ginsengisoli TaxID=453575 RepID=UPI00102247C9|nr:tripartite tricarboxylate transporter substrate binding protein [Allopusillimonas ginsengisoli]TEA78852.1 tripartite tricarboxylate transporter substrate binding protein [Allopusillimonas ginsengisoli]